MLREAWGQRSACSAGRTQMMICADGKVSPCEQMAENNKNFCGDLKNQLLQEVWNSQEFDEKTIHLDRDKFIDTVCYDCDEWEKCHVLTGNCIRDTSIRYGTIYAPPANCPKVDSPFIRIL